MRRSWPPRSFREHNEHPSKGACVTRILLVEPAKGRRSLGGEDVMLSEPLALEYLGVAVAPHHDVQILTPLPGTNLMEERRQELLTSDFDFHDFLHTLLPTTLPLKDFHEEYYQRFRHAVRLARSLRLLSRYPLCDIPATLSKGLSLYAQLREAYRDYGSTVAG
jgi:hypothetical protein